MVTRRHHPLLDVVKRGLTQLVARLREGTSMRLPCAWTDVAGPTHNAAETILTADSLRLLLNLVDALRTRGIGTDVVMVTGWWSSRAPSGQPLSSFACAIALRVRTEFGRPHPE